MGANINYIAEGQSIGIFMLHSLYCEAINLIKDSNGAT